MYTFFQFTQNKQMRSQLLETKATILAEASPWDTKWGIGIF